MCRPPPRPTLFPYTTLFRSDPASYPDLVRSGIRRPPLGPERTRSASVRGRLRILLIAAFLALVDLRSEEHTSELQSRVDLVCRLLLEKKKSRQSTRLEFTSF